MSKEQIFPGVPKAVMDRYHQCKSGYTRVISGVIITTKEWSPEDEETMKRLLTDVEITSKKVWEEISIVFPNEKDQLKLFNAAWMARLNYDSYRYDNKEKGNRKKCIAKKLKIKIKTHAEQLSALLNELNDLGYRSTRYPDSNINSLSIQSELQWLLERVKKFDPGKISDEDFINSALSSNKENYKMEYLRAFIAILHESGFPLERENINERILAPLASAAIGNLDGGVSMNDVYNVIKILHLK